MDFKTDARRACHEKGAKWMREIFGEFAHIPEEEPVIIVAAGSALAICGLHPWGEDEATICTRAQIEQHQSVQFRAIAL